jgi:hypothetical protein
MVAPAQAEVRACPAPAGEPLSAQFKVSVEQTDVPVYLARIMGVSALERKTMGVTKIEDTSTASFASFASFDMDGTVKVTVTCNKPVTGAKLLPTASGVTPEFLGNTVTFTVTKPSQLTLEVNGNWVNSLHLFANPMETDIPNPNDPNVIYFGPGIHQLHNNIEVTSGKTLYIAAGAVIYGHYGEFGPERGGAPIFYLHGSNITLRGRGIIDGSLCPYHSRSILLVNGTNIRIEGIILRDPSGWTMPVRKSDHVTISNVKVFGWRGNSDGMDICNSRDVEIDDCFLRTFDDLIVLKTDKGQGELRNVTVRRCVLWNELAHALSLGAELREPLTNVLFSDCDVIRDRGREWLLRVYNCDSAPVKNVVFDHIRIEDAQRLMSVWIGKAMWSREAERGHIDDVTFSHITSVMPEVPFPYADLVGFDAGHAINQVRFQDVTVGGQALKASDVRQNAFVHEVSMEP